MRHDISISYGVSRRVTPWTYAAFPPSLQHCDGEPMDLQSARLRIANCNPRLDAP